jgi:predicted membrane chloride channel (bestrophin family)
MQPSNAPNNPNHAKWFKTAFAWHGTALPRCADRILIATVYCALVQAVIEFEFVNRYVPFFKSAGFDSFAHTILGSLIGFLLVVARTGASSSTRVETSHEPGRLIPMKAKTLRD